MYSIRNPYLFQNGVAKIIQPGSVSRLRQELGHSPGLQGLLPQLGHGIVKLDAMYYDLAMLVVANFDF